MLILKPESDSFRRRGHADLSEFKASWSCWGMHLHALDGYRVVLGRQATTFTGSINNKRSSTSLLPHPYFVWTPGLFFRSPVFQCSCSRVSTFSSFFIHLDLRPLKPVSKTDRFPDSSFISHVWCIECCLMVAGKTLVRQHDACRRASCDYYDPLRHNKDKLTFAIPGDSRRS